ncbi:MAG: glutamate 5-kinase [Clostridiales bacterium]|nr:glutamate 5-kinase [Clostridiales bacterium]
MRLDIKDYKRIVVKIGTSTLTLPNGKLHLRRMDKLSWALTDLRNRGKEIVLVSSGAIAVGTERLGLAARPRDIQGKQAASAVGQAVLMQIYENFFQQYNQKVAQILITRDVLENERRKENARNTFFTLLSLGVIPIVNENDTVSTDELDFSDNDALSALVAILTDSELLIMLSDTEGVYNKDPHDNPDARLIKELRDITDEVLKFSQETPSATNCGSDVPSRVSLGTGGMLTKLLAAKSASEAGIDTVIASGENPGILFDIIDGNTCGTYVPARKK